MAGGRVPDVEAVVLDVGGVFVVPAGAAVRTALARVGVDVDPGDDEVVAAHYHGMAAYDRSDDRPERWPAYVDAYLGFLGVEADAAATAVMLEAWHGPSDGLWVHVLDDNVAALRALADADVPLAVVSNSDGTVEALLGRLGVAQVGAGPGVPVAAIVDSGVVGVTKPDPALFAPALAALDLDPGRCLYVGDSYRNDVVGGRAAGMAVAQIDPFGLAPDDGQRRVADLAEVAATLVGERRL